MRDFSAINRLSFSHGPTPLEAAPRLSNALDCKVYFKRDDCTGLAGGGNKTRKLEYLVADAQEKGADTLVTIGGLQSNHARQSAAIAAKLGLRCELVLEDVPNTPKADYYKNGNLLLDQLLGANIHRLGEGEDAQLYSEALMSKLVEQGAKPYLIPIGGSNVIGALGYVRCAFEIVKQLEQQQLEIDQIILASGSAGTQAGLLAGLIASGSSIKVLGINVSRTAEQQSALVCDLLEQVLEYLEIDKSLAQGVVHTNGDYFGSGYGVPTEQMISAVKRCAALEGVLLDPVYTGKAMAGFMDLVSKKEIAAGSKQLFLHTGGAQGLFAYSEVFSA
ncbi:MAG: D-cysteine desulfhydrase [Oceanospirillaceae bacterium]|nr:D-cysteine desulfhydrase [Oceanospirillaceae bacterium]